MYLLIEPYVNREDDSYSKVTSQRKEFQRSRTRLFVNFCIVISHMRRILAARTPPGDVAVRLVV